MCFPYPSFSPMVTSLIIDDVTRNHSCMSLFHPKNNQMKKSILKLLPVLCIFFSRAHAQAPFSTADSVNINNINARVMVHGDMFWNPATEVAACEFPKGSGKHMNFVSALWMSGYDAYNQLHV